MKTPQQKATPQQLALFEVASDRPMLLSSLEAFYNSLAGIVSPATEVFYHSHLPSLAAFLGDVPIDCITIAQLRAWRGSLAAINVLYAGTKREKPGSLSPYSLHQYVRTCRRFFAWMVEEGLLSVNPALRLELPQLPKQTRRGIPAEARTAILAACNNPRDFAILRMLADTGCRVGGLVRLTLEDLDLDAALCVVWEKGRGGSRKSRMLFLLPATVAALRAYLAVRPDIGNRVFVGRKRKSLTVSGIYQAVHRAANQAGVKKDWNPHNWRHGRIRGWLKAGMPLSTASQLAGHSSIKTTGDIYGTFNQSELAEAALRYA